MTVRFVFVWVSLAMLFSVGCDTGEQNTANLPSEVTAPNNEHLKSNNNLSTEANAARKKTDASVSDEPRIPTWIQRDIQDGDFVLSLGYFEDSESDAVEPAVSIRNDDGAYSDAEVFASLMSNNGETVVEEEVSGAFDTKVEAYCGMNFPRPAQACMLRFRIRFPDAETESIYDVECPEETPVD